MRKQDNLSNNDRLRKVPFIVPDGYFESFNREMMKNLPEYPEELKQQPLSRWQRFKPYIYMAAMFLGIWCMMKVFHHVSSPSTLSIDNPPEQVTLALSDNNLYDFYSTSYEVDDDVELESEVSGMYTDIKDFEEDFGYTISPEYSKIDISNDIN